MTKTKDACTVCGAKAICNGTSDVTCKDKADKVKSDLSDCEPGCTAGANGEMLVWVTDGCQCPADKSTLGGKIDKDAKC